MEKQDYFKQALANFTFEMASGGAIRSLADQGYTVRQIAERLDYPTPLEKIQKTYMSRLLENGTLLIDEPGSKNEEPKYTYIKEYDKNGRPSFRRVTLDSPKKCVCRQNIFLHEQIYSPKFHGQFAAYLMKKCADNGEDSSYVSLDFGLQIGDGMYQQILQALNTRQTEYIQGIPWETRQVYHRLNKRMQEIIIRLYDQQLYSGACYFMKTGEKIIL